jgi:glutaconate CoA-transferase subunit A
VNAASGRTPVLVDEEQALDFVEDGMTVAFGGFNTAAHPMMIVRGLIRRGRRGLRVVGSAIAGLDLDLLIGAGVADEVVTSSVTGEVLAGTGPFFRGAAEAGEVRVWECDEGIYYAALRAAAQGLPFLPWKAGLGSSIPEVNPDLKVFADPISGEELLAVPAIQPDVAFIHLSRADRNGLGQHIGSGFGDRMLNRAAARTVITTERVVSTEEIRSRAAETSIPYADAVVFAPWGAHPFSSPGHYLVDEQFLSQYVAVANAARKGDRGDFEQFLATYVMEPASHLEYLERVGLRRLLELEEWL